MTGWIFCADRPANIRCLGVALARLIAVSAPKPPGVGPVIKTVHFSCYPFHGMPDNVHVLLLALSRKVSTTSFPVVSTPNAIIERTKGTEAKLASKDCQGGQVELSLMPVCSAVGNIFRLYIQTYGNLAPGNPAAILLCPQQVMTEWK